MNWIVAVKRFRRACNSHALFHQLYSLVLYPFAKSVKCGFDSQLDYQRTALNTSEVVKFRLR